MNSTLLCFVAFLLFLLFCSCSLAAESLTTSNQQLLKNYLSDNNASSFSSSLLQKTTTITYYCNTHDDCYLHRGASSSCNSDGRCVCDIGHEVLWENKGPCGKWNCSDSLECIQTYGIHSYCKGANRQICACNSGYAYDLRSEQCAKEEPLYCTSNYDCTPHLGLWSACNRKRQCVCRMGFERKGGALGTLCQRRPCITPTDCTDKYGNHSQCSLNLCFCNPRTSYDLNDEQCSPDYYGGNGGGGCDCGSNFALAIRLQGALSSAGLLLIFVALTYLSFSLD